MTVSKAEVLEYAELESKAAPLEREAKTYRERQRQLEDKFEDDLKESKKPSVVRHGYTFVWVNGSATVAWAAEFLKECGVTRTNKLKADAASAATAAKMKILPPAIKLENTPEE